LPLRDELGNPTVQDFDTPADSVTVRSDSDLVQLKPGFFPLRSNLTYTVLSRENGGLNLFFAAATLTQAVFVAETDVTFLSVADYNKATQAVIQDSKDRADKALAEGHFAGVGDIFKRYQGEFADETTKEREQLAKEYDERASVAEQRFEADQKARGLVQYEGQWMTTNQVAEAEEQRTKQQEQQYEAVQRANGLVLYDGKWVTPEEKSEEEAKKVGVSLANEIITEERTDFDVWSKVTVAEWDPLEDKLAGCITASFAIQNKSNHEIHDIQIICRFMGHSGTEIDRNKQTIYETIPAGTRLTVKNFRVCGVPSQTAYSIPEVAGGNYIK
jgi:hypothetical protein